MKRKEREVNMAEVKMGEVKGINCVKDYGMITFVKQGNDAVCPISGARNCEKCYVISSEEAKKGKQVKKGDQEIQERKGRAHSY